MEANIYVNAGFWTLMAATFMLASSHTLSPDHWFPFVMFGRANRWKTPQVLGLAALAGGGHVLTSVIIGLLGVFAEAGLSKDIAIFLEKATPFLLIIFGFGYAAYAYYQQKVTAHGHSHGIPILNKWLGIDPHAYELHSHNHNHHGGLQIGKVNLYLHNLEIHMKIDHDDHLHGYDASKEMDHCHRHTHGELVVHEHKHQHRKSGLHEHDHEEGYEYLEPAHNHHHLESVHSHDHDPHHVHPHPLHHHEPEHSHQSKKMEIKGKRAGWGLVAILGLTPCIALLPLTFAAVKYGALAVILVNINFAFTTIATITLLTWLGMKGVSWIRMEFFDRYGDILAGVIIGLLGIATGILEL